MFAWLFGWLYRLLGWGEIPVEGRSPGWPKLRGEWLARQPECQVCGTRKDLAVHHVLPVWRYPTFELDNGNLITLCNGDGGGCHFRHGHLFSWRSWNPHVREDAGVWRGKIAMRPRS
jgi:hypothetical protein